jgi:hypothetical protein
MLGIPLASRLAAEQYRRARHEMFLSGVASRAISALALSSVGIRLVAKATITLGAASG